MMTRVPPHVRTISARVLAATLPLAVAGGAWALMRAPAAAPVPAVAATPVVAAVDAAAGVTAVQQTRAGPAGRAVRAPGCERCHGELEFLRQQTGSMARAEALLVPHAVVVGSAHGDMTCADCHAGFARWPHDDARARTSTCVSCHAPADSAWHRGIHARADDPVTCAQCHGAHDIAAADLLRTRHGAGTANAPCIACHQGERLERHTPHSDSVSCAACHAPHDVRPIDDPASWLSPANQLRTCGSCHDSVSAVWRSDIHGDDALRAAHLGGRAAAADIVSCTSCHYGHRMLNIDDPAFVTDAVMRCASCHEKAASTFFGSYHGKATALGSHVSASCHDCHGAHDILPDSMPASHVAQANLVETCRACHAYARPAFVLYDAHPDPFNRARNPWIFYSFWFMNGLLIFVLLVFGAHTLLWWIRIILDRRKGIGHGHGSHGDVI